MRIKEALVYMDGGVIDGVKNKLLWLGLGATKILIDLDFCLPIPKKWLVFSFR